MGDWETGERLGEREKFVSCHNANCQTGCQASVSVGGLAETTSKCSMAMELVRWELSRATGVVEEVDTTCVTI